LDPEIGRCCGRRFGNDDEQERTKPFLKKGYQPGRFCRPIFFHPSFLLLHPFSVRLVSATGLIGRLVVPGSKHGPLPEKRSSVAQAIFYTDESSKTKLSSPDGHVVTSGARF